MVLRSSIGLCNFISKINVLLMSCFLGIANEVYSCFAEKGVADLNRTILPVVLEVHTVVTVLQLVLGYPLTVSISSLRCYSCHFGVLITQINLQPLINIIGFS